MIGRTLAERRDHVESLASPDGAFYLVCARTGDRPVPATGKRFAARPAARSAARAVEQYRATLRRYDPRMPYYDVIVCEDADGGSSAESVDQPPAENGTLSAPVLDAVRPHRSNRALIGFCHRVAAAVFESLSAVGHGDVEERVMTAYTDLADAAADPDRLCLHLLERLAAEIDTALSPDAQASLLSAAATRLGPLESTAETPVSATLERLADRDLLDGHRRSPWSVDLDDGRRSVDIRLSAYALAPRGDRLPVLPLAVDLYRRRPDWPLSSVRVADLDDAWRVSLVFQREADPDGLACAPIDEV